MDNDNITVLATYEPRQQMMAVEWTLEDLAALKQTVAKDCDAAQFKVFVMAAKRLGLDPFARQIVPIVQGGRMTPQVTIDGFRLISERTGKYAGILGPEWCGSDGVWHDVWLSNEAPVAARVGIIRRDFVQPVWGVARIAAYKQGTPTWTKMPDVMGAKVAESLARRIAFPQELSGIYTREEMAQALDDDDAAPVIEHGGRRVDTSTGEVLSETDDERTKRRVDESMQIRVPGGPAQPAKAEKSKAESVNWGPISGRLTAVGIPAGPTRDEFARFATAGRDKPGKNWAQLTDADLPRVEKLLTRIEDKHRQAEAALAAASTEHAEVAADSPASDQGEPEPPDEVA